MKKINIETLEKTILEKTKNIKFNNKQELSDFVDVEIVQKIEREHNPFLLRYVSEYIDNLDEFRDCVNDYVNSFEFEDKE
jgi:hypothetical protein